MRRRLRRFDSNARASVRILDLENVAVWPPALLHVLEREYQALLHMERPTTDRYSLQELEQSPARALAYDRAIEALAEALHPFSLIGWHCTRLTQDEVDTIVAQGLHLPTAALLNQRIDRVVASDLLSAPVGIRLKAAHQAADANRAGKLWFCFFAPRQAGERGIGRFFRHWGGEALYNSHEDDPVTSPALRVVGTPALIEADVPIESLHGRDISLPMNVGRRYVISCGNATEETRLEFEDYIVRPLPAKRVRRVIRFPEADFLALTGCTTWRDPIQLTAEEIGTR